MRPLLEGERFDGVWSSDLRRAARTARLAIAADAQEDRRLREMSFGSLEGQPWETLDESWQQALARFEGFEPPGGETFAELRRAGPVLRRVARRRAATSSSRTAASCA